MVALSLQTLLLMGAAYLLGAIVACAVRRTLYRVTASAAGERRVDPLPEVAQAGAARFGKVAADERPTRAPAVIPTADKPKAPADQQDLKRIRLVEPALEAALNAQGVFRYDQIAAWMRGDIDRLEAALGVKGRINQENWIEQAQVLAKGGETQYATRRARGETANAEPTADEGERRTMQPATTVPRPHVVTPRTAGGGASAVAAEIAPPKSTTMQDSARATAAIAAALATPEVSSRAAFAGEAKAPPPATSSTATANPGLAGEAVAMRPTTPSARDNLQRIGNIDAQTEQRLAAQGVTRYSQLAQWSPVDVERWDKTLATAGRIARENWVEQAQILSRGGDTAYSRDYDRRSGEAVGQLRPAKLSDAIRGHSAVMSSEEGRSISRAELGSLRSVRSQAYQNAEPGPEAARRAVAQNKVVRSAALEDLKRIRGIGVLIEKKLNSMGVVSYEQIANWTAGDIERVSQSLDFKGRIERENWIEQARILASGGATEFSRRMDRGEIETSRAKS